MISIGIKELLDAGVHFGHQTKRWNPKMKPFIFDARNGIHIIDLQQTVRRLDEAVDWVKDLAADGGKILFVGTKKQAQDAIRELDRVAEHDRDEVLPEMRPERAARRRAGDEVTQILVGTHAGCPQAGPRRFELGQLRALRAARHDDEGDERQTADPDHGGSVYGQRRQI